MRLIAAARTSGRSVVYCFKTRAVSRIGVPISLLTGKSFRLLLAQSG
jgi:hypothetical protein